MRIPYVLEVIVKGIENEEGAETGLLAEVFLSQDKIKELQIENVESTLKKIFQMHAYNFLFTKKYHK